MNEIQIRNRQRACRLRTPLLLQAARHLLDHQLHLTTYALGLHLLTLPGMTALNRRWLNHDGPTDVITFDHRAADPALILYGEIFLCPEQAQIQARRFRVPWTLELTRHLVHGVLHLQGYDDQSNPARLRMKRRENLLLQKLRRDVDLRQISSDPDSSHA